MRSLVGALTAALILSASSTAIAEEHPQRPNRALLVTGAAIGVGAYGVTASFAAAGKRAADRDLFVPVVGPFLNLSNRNCAVDCVTTTADLAALWASAGLQMLGAGLVVASVAMPEPARPASRPQEVRLTSGSLAPDEAEAPRERRPHRTLLWTGVSAFTVTYAGTALTGAFAGDRVPDKNLFIPLVGPWLDLGQRDCDHRPCDPTEESIFKSLMIASGVVQGGAAIMTASSFFISEKPSPSSSDVRVVPISYAGGLGIGVVGLF